MYVKRETVWAEETELWPGDGTRRFRAVIVRTYSYKNANMNYPSEVDCSLEKVIGQDAMGEDKWESVGLEDPRVALFLLRQFTKMSEEFCEHVDGKNGSFGYRLVEEDK